jgi:hypothetical protein
MCRETGEKNGITTSHMRLRRYPLECRGRPARRLHVPLPSLSAAHRKHLQRARLFLQELREDGGLSEAMPPNR